MTHSYTHDEVIKAAQDAVNLFIEYRDVHGFTEQDAKLQALAEVAEGTSPATLADMDEIHAWQAKLPPWGNPDRWLPPGGESI